MSTTTKIEWATKTWSPLLGCEKVTAGCDNCYAIGTAAIRAGHPNPKISSVFAGLTHRGVTGRLDWTGEVRTLPQRLNDPSHWRKPERIFVNPMSDLFHADVSDKFIAQVFAVMTLCQQHTFQLLTKRHGRMRFLLSSDEFRAEVARLAVAMAEAEPGPPYLPEDLVVTAGRSWWPLPNVWVGVSVEDQKTAELRIPALLDTPAGVRWLSCEPLLGPIRLAPEWLAPKVACARTVNGLDAKGIAALATLSRAAVRHHAQQTGEHAQGYVDWIVIGGESGPRARPMHPQWARGLRDQAVSAGIPLHFKQWGTWGPAPWVVRVCDPAEGWTGTPEQLREAKADAEARGATHAYPVWADQNGYELYEPPHKPWSLERAELDETTHAPMRRWGKKAAGRVLDGQVWEQYPAQLAREAVAA